MSRHVPRRLRWSRLDSREYRWGTAAVCYEKGAWWALVAYQRREPGAEGRPAGPWLDRRDRIGPFKRPRNAMLAAEERVLLLGRQPPDTVRLQAGHA